MIMGDAAEVSPRRTARADPTVDDAAPPDPERVSRRIVDGGRGSDQAAEPPSRGEPPRESQVTHGAGEGGAGQPPCAAALPDDDPAIGGSATVAATPVTVRRSAEHHRLPTAAAPDRNTVVRPPAAEASLTSHDSSRADSYTDFLRRLRAAVAGECGDPAVAEPRRAGSDQPTGSAGEARYEAEHGPWNPGKRRALERLHDALMHMGTGLEEPLSVRQPTSYASGRSSHESPSSESLSQRRAEQHWASSTPARLSQETGLPPGGPGGATQAETPVRRQQWHGPNDTGVSLADPAPRFPAPTQHFPGQIAPIVPPPPAHSPARLPPAGPRPGLGRITLEESLAASIFPSRLLNATSSPSRTPMRMMHYATGTGPQSPAPAMFAGTVDYSANLAQNKLLQTQWLRTIPEFGGDISLPWDNSGSVSFIRFLHLFEKAMLEIAAPPWQWLAHVRERMKGVALAALEAWDSINTVTMDISPRDSPVEVQRALYASWRQSMMEQSSCSGKFLSAGTPTASNVKAIGNRYVGDVLREIHFAGTVYPAVRSHRSRKGLDPVSEVPKWFPE